MEIYDNGYLTEDEKRLISVQDLIYVAISNYMNLPLPEIYPNHIYRYELNGDGTISTTILKLLESDERKTNVLWDVFLHHDNGSKRSSVFTTLIDIKEIYVFEYYINPENGLCTNFPVPIRELVCLENVQTSPNLMATPSLYEKHVLYSTCEAPKQVLEELFDRVKGDKTFSYTRQRRGSIGNSVNRI